MMAKLKFLLIFAALFAVSARLSAQTETPTAPPPTDAPPIPAQRAEAVADDGLTLMGDYYPLPDAPVVILLHQLYTDRRSWTPFVGMFLGSGYSVLAVDLRGFGETGGKIAWQKAVGDVQTWFNWLRQQPGVRGDAISVIGSSMGSNLALVGCANDPQCMTVIAISPGLNYYGILTRQVVTKNLSQRSALLVTSRRDVYSGGSVVKLRDAVGKDSGVVAQIYEGNAHGMELFTADGDDLKPLIIDWLNDHLPK